MILTRQNDPHPPTSSSRSTVFLTGRLRRDLVNAQVGAASDPPATSRESRRLTSRIITCAMDTEGVTVLTAGEFRRHLYDRQIPVMYVATLDTGQFQVHLHPGIEPERFDLLIEEIQALPEVRSAQRPPTPRGADVLHITPSWLPETTMQMQPPPEDAVRRDRNPSFEPRRTA